MSGMVYQFPHPAEDGATLRQRFASRLSIAIGKLCAWVGVPGAMRNADILDDLTGQDIRVRVGPLFTKLSVNGRDYFFCRYTGKFDGTGMGCG